MITRGLKQNLMAIQHELLRLSYKLITSHREMSSLYQKVSLEIQDTKRMSRLDIKLKNWRYVIMRNLFMNNYCEIIKEQPLSEETEKSYNLVPTENVEFKMEDTTCYDLKLIHRFVDFLPRAYKIPFKMYISGFSYQEISKKLALPIETVKSRIRFTHLHLQSLLEWLG